MARHARRLITWIGGGVLALALLVVLAVLALVWLVDPNAWRARIAQSASNALGRQVQLGGDLHWNIGWNIAIASEGGSIANAPGFDATPFAQWQQLQFGLNARALLGKRIVIDQLAIDGLQVNLQRNASGRRATGTSRQPGAPDADAATSASKPIALQVASIRLRDSQLTFSDARGVVAPAAPAVWRLRELALDVRLPLDLRATNRVNCVMSRCAAGSPVGPLPAAGVAVEFDAASLKQDAATATLSVPAFQARWDDAQLSGSVDAAYGAPVAARGRLTLRVPSVRTQLALLGVTLPPMADPKTLGKLDIDGIVDLKGPTLAVTDLQVALDDTQLDRHGYQCRSSRRWRVRFDLQGDEHRLRPLSRTGGLQGQAFRVATGAVEGAECAGRAADEVRNRHGRQSHGAAH